LSRSERPIFIYTRLLPTLRDTFFFSQSRRTFANLLRCVAS
jgi:hypothetical protein